MDKSQGRDMKRALGPVNGAGQLADAANRDLLLLDRAFSSSGFADLLKRPYTQFLNRSAFLSTNVLPCSRLWVLPIIQFDLTALRGSSVAFT